MYILRPLHLFKLLSSLLYQFSLNLSLFHTTIYHVYICIFWDVLRCPCTIVLSQVVVQLNLTALVSKSLESATARYQTRTETQRAQLSLEPSNKAQEVQALEISNDNLATTPRGRHFLLRLVLAARLLAPASENACIPGNAPVKTTGLPKILAFFWWQIYRNCSENMALVSTRAKRAKNDPEGLAALAGRQSYDHDSDAATAVPSCASLSLWRLGWSRQPGLGRFCRRPAMWLRPLCRVFPNLGRFAAMPGESCKQKTASFFFFSY